MPKKMPARFTNEDAARKHLEALQWPDGPVCPHCGAMERSSRIKGGRAGLLFCNACRQQYTVTVGTVFERSKVPLHTWLYANHLLCSSKKGISSHQMSRMLGVSYKTAWFMTHRIREAMAPKKGSAEPMGGLNRVVEADETYFGKVDVPGSVTPKNKPYKKRGRGPANKNAVVALVERNGSVRSFHVETANRDTVSRIVRENIAKETILHTDESQLYVKLLKAGLVRDHHTVKHTADEYVRGDVTTNRVEGVFSVFKRGMHGTYQHCGERHLHRYLAEFDFRFNNRSALGVNDDMRADEALRNISGKRLTYRRTSEWTYA